MENTLIFAFGALVGVIIYRALVVLRLASIGIGMFKLTELNCLQLLALTIEDASFVKETKHRIMERTNSFTDAQIEVTKIVDEQLLGTWKEKSIKKLLSRYPQGMQDVAQYNDWPTGMAWLNLNVEKVLDK